MNPINSHFSNEFLELFYQKEEIKWPKINEEILVENNKNFVVQINGKTRGIIEIKKDSSEKKVVDESKKAKKINELLKKSGIKKIIFIKNKIINYLTNEKK